MKSSMSEYPGPRSSCQRQCFVDLTDRQDVGGRLSERASAAEICMQHTTRALTRTNVQPEMSIGGLTFLLFPFFVLPLSSLFSPTFFSSNLSSLFLPSLFFFSPIFRLRSRVQLVGLEERCELQQQSLKRSASRNRIWYYSLTF